VRSRVGAVDSAAEHGNGCAARLERASVGMSVHASGEAADDDQPRGGELAAEHSRDVGAVGRARASADDRDRRPVEQRELGCAAHEQPRRSVEDRPERRRERGRRARQPAQASRLDAGEVAPLVELAAEPGEPVGAGHVDEMRVRVCGERREGELAHRGRSSEGVR
jgi:hypothetical protein